MAESSGRPTAAKKSAAKKETAGQKKTSSKAVNKAAKNAVKDAPAKKWPIIPKEKVGRIIAIVNQKGGVGKTTTAINLAAALAERGRRVLLVDCDAQCNATSGAGITLNIAAHTIFELMDCVIDDETDISSFIVPAKQDGFDVIPGNRHMSGLEADLALLPPESRCTVLRDVITPFKKKNERDKKGYDYIIIDCPPSLGFISLNALTAADGVIVPIQCEYYALEGIVSLLKTIQERVKDSLLNPRLEIDGIVLTMYDSKTSLSKDVVTSVRAMFPEKAYQSLIPRSVRIAESPSYGMSVLARESTNRGSAAYRELAEEVIRRGH